jgi:ferredoxin
MTENQKTKIDPATQVLVCNCEDTMALDVDGLAAGLGCSKAPQAFTQLCRRQVGAFESAIGSETSIMVACTQEAPLFGEIAGDREGEPPSLLFVNIREQAGWSGDGADKTPKMAALIAAAAIEAKPTAVMTIRSEGQCLVYGAGQQTLDAAERLASRLSVTVVLTDPGDAIPPAVVDVPLHTGRVRSATGTLGRFAIEFDRFAAAVPSSRQALAFETPRNGVSTTCDIILDLSGGTPLFTDTVKHDGYVRVDPGNPVAVAEALLEATDLVGEFEKPFYVSFDETICAHSRSTKIGCRNCIDNCPTGAIASNGDVVAIDPAVCGGCGSCSAVCPTGAVSYDFPGRNDLIRRIQTLATTYLEAGGSHPVLLIHDEGHGTTTINMMARYGRGLPANVIPLAVYSVFETGHDILAAAFAAGFGYVAIIVPPERQHDLPALDSQVRLTDSFMAALGFGSGRVVLFGEPDPEKIEGALYGLSRREVIAADAFAPIGGKREIARSALLALNAAAPEAHEFIVLPDGAPYGRLLVNVEGCTLCLACVGACPAGALTDDADHPRLRFNEQACVQCGLCVATCPEKVIALEPRYNFTKAILEPVTIKEEEPFHCISCGKPFGTKSSIERIVAQLAGRHSMFQSKDQADIIRMCDDCRVITIAERGGDPMASGERPRVRTTEDYIVEEAEARKANGEGKE